MTREIIKPVDLTHVRGDDWALRHEFVDEDGLAMDVSGWTFTGQFRADADDDDALGSMTFDTSAAADGLVISRGDGDDLSEGAFVYYDIQVVTEAGFKKTIQFGVIKLVRDTTRP
jgi:hypothetical protein